MPLEHHARIRRTRWYRSHQRIVHSGTWRPHFNISSSRKPYVCYIIFANRTKFCSTWEQMSSLIYRYIFEVSHRSWIYVASTSTRAYLIVQTSTQTKNLQSATLLRSSGTDEAYARYKYDNSLFGSNSYHVDMFVTQNILRWINESIIDHARCFNNLLVEDATIDIGWNSEIYMSSCVDMIQTSIAKKLWSSLSSNSSYSFRYYGFWSLSYLVCGAVDFPDSLHRVSFESTRVHGRTNHPKIRIRWLIGSILSAVINIPKKRHTCDPDMIVKLKKLRNHLVSIIEITEKNWLYEHGLYLQFNKLFSIYTRTHSIFQILSVRCTIWYKITVGIKMDSSVVVLVIFLVVLSLRQDWQQFNSTTSIKESEQETILDKHHQVSADLTDLTVKLVGNLQAEKSSTTGTRI
jgi:hypothetical protein